MTSGVCIPNLWDSLLMLSVRIQVKTRTNASMVREAAREAIPTAIQIPR